jgi:YegS/Rv2252/BmrU family lipid kinase
MNPLCIVNPHSHGGQTSRRAEHILTLLTERLGSIDVARTERSRHAVDIAEQAARDGRGLVISIGGDGTIHEIVNGLMRAPLGSKPRPRLGIVGQGTGGDLRRTLGLEHRLESYLDAIASGRTRAIDVGRFSYVDHEDRPAEAWFVNILSMGMGGLVDRYVATLSRSLPGSMAYFVATTRALKHSVVGELRCTLHHGDATEHVRLRCRNLAICNGRYFGSGMHVAPMAVPDDGLLHVVSLGGVGGRVGFALSSLSIYSGTHVQRPEVQVHECQGIDVELENREAQERFLLDVDGEPLGKLPVRVELVPKALEVLVG